MRESIKGICKECLGCNKLDDPLFTGVDKCEFCSKEQITFKQIKLGGYK